MKPTIVVAMIVKNEHDTLSHCLDSVKGADAIYISDTGSDDDTVEIAKRYTPHVWTEDKWDDNFSKARNFILNKIPDDGNTFVLSIDSDEVLHDFSKVREAAEQAQKQGALAIDVKLIADRDKQIHYFPRFFKRSPKVWWEAAVHNHISEGATMTSDIEITYGYSPAHLKDPNRAMRILQKEVERTGNPREIYYLGREYWYRFMYADCVKTMGQYVQKAHFLAEKADAFLIMSKCYIAMGDWDSARDSCAQCLIINPHFKEAVLHMAKLAGKGSGNPIWEKKGEFWEKAAQMSDNSNVLFVRN